MLLLTNQFHDSFECLSMIGYKTIGGQYLSRCFRDPLIRRPCVARAGELSKLILTLLTDLSH